MTRPGLLTLALLACACAPASIARADSPPPSPDPARVVAVAAASDLMFALDEVVAEMARANAGIAVKVTYGASGSFFAQIASGAPFDVFFSADADYIRRLGERGLTRRESEFIFAVGRLVLWVPAGSPVQASRGLSALTHPTVRRVAIANPRHAPYGRAAETALRSLGFYEAVHPKLVFGENVAQAAQFAQSGAADAGLIALSLALAPPMKGGTFHEVPREAYPRLEQGAVILARARDPEAAQALCAFVKGARGRAVLARFGFAASGE